MSILNAGKKNPQAKSSLDADLASEFLFYLHLGPGYLASGFDLISIQDLVDLASGFVFTCIQDLDLASGFVLDLFLEP